MEQGLLPAELQIPAEAAGLTAAEALKYANLAKGALGLVGGLGAGAAKLGGLGKTGGSGNVSKPSGSSGTNNLANAQAALDTSPNLLRVGKTATDPLAELKTQEIRVWPSLWVTELWLRTNGCKWRINWWISRICKWWKHKTFVLL